jgi:hypothetical protein
LRVPRGDVLKSTIWPACVAPFLVVLQRNNHFLFLLFQLLVDEKLADYILAGISSALLLKRERVV